MHRVEDAQSGAKMLYKAFHLARTEFQPPKHPFFVSQKVGSNNVFFNSTSKPQLPFQLFSNTDLCCQKSYFNGRSHVARGI